MLNKSVFVRVPASTANLGPGFDTLGMALNLYAWIEMKPAKVTSIQLYGDQLEGIPTDKNNLIYKVADKLFARAGVEMPELEISMYSDIPLSRGLGSSASAIVGALVAANGLLASPLDRNELFQMATQLENHPDNVGASLYGGIVVTNWHQQTARQIQVVPDPRIEVLVAIPDFHLETKKAREVLPKQVSLEEAVFNVSHASMLVAALTTGNLAMIKHAMKDRLHQPYRASLIPGMSYILQHATEKGALGAALSGAGPTMLALLDRQQSNEEKEALQTFLIEALKDQGIPSRTIWLEPCLQGAEVLTELSANSTFIDNIKSIKERNGYGSI